MYIYLCVYKSIYAFYIFYINKTIFHISQTLIYSCQYFKLIYKILKHTQKSVLRYEIEMQTFSNIFRIVEFEISQFRYESVKGTAACHAQRWSCGWIGWWAFCWWCRGWSHFNGGVGVCWCCCWRCHWYCCCCWRINWWILHVWIGIGYDGCTQTQIRDSKREREKGREKEREKNAKILSKMSKS